MSVSRFPEPSPKTFPFGTNSVTPRAVNPISGGIYEVSVSGAASVAASANGLAFVSSSGFMMPVTTNAGNGMVTLPWESSSSVVAASLVMPTVIKMEKLLQNRPTPPTSVAASFDPAYSGSYVVNATVPAGAASVTLYFPNQARRTVSSLPASVTNVDYDFADAFGTGAWRYAMTYVDTNGVTSEAASGSLAFAQSPGFYATGGTVVTSGGQRYHTFTSTGTLSVLKSGSFEYVIVGGGGSGAGATQGNAGGGGGAGRFTQSNASATTGSITITVAGAGGTSSIGSIVSASQGVSASAGPGGASGNGFAGANGGGGNYGGGGGSAIAAATTSTGANGAISASAWATATGTGSSSRYAAGGGGGSSSFNSAGAGGGTGGGGTGGSNLAGATGGTANTGSGGGGGNGSNITNNGGAGGGSGIVMIRYAV